MSAKARAKKGYKGPRVKDTETFIQKALWRHGEEYDYSLVDYKNASEKVQIVCNKHGTFWQVPNDHVNSGAGCRKCKYEMMKDFLSSDTDEFIGKASRVHSSKYDYSQVVYKNNRKKVKIICPTHGLFNQTPDAHLSGDGCPPCKAATIGNLWRKSKEDFVLEAKEVHGEKFDYSLVEYKNCNEKVRIICPVHGVFEQTPGGHLSASTFGCSQCWKDSMSDILTTNEEDFISKAKEIHGNKYSYKNFSGFYNKVQVTCPTHGEFWQRAGNHIYHTSGCPKCSMLRSQGWGAHKQLYSSSEPSNIYIVRLTDKFNNRFIKVGLSNNIEKRHKIISYDSNCEIELVYSLEGPANKLFKIEHMVLHCSGFRRYLPEFKFGGSSECLVDGQENAVIDFIEEHINV